MPADLDATGSEPRRAKTQAERRGESAGTAPAKATRESAGGSGGVAAAAGQGEKQINLWAESVLLRRRG